MLAERMVRCTNQLSITTLLVGHRTAVTIQLPEFSFCAPQATAPIWTNVAVILQITQGGAMCVFAIAQVIRQSLRMYRVTKQWQLNRYMGLFVKQGILYFLACVPVSSFPSVYPAAIRARKHTIYQPN
jgi:hypothetical protein